MHLGGQAATACLHALHEGSPCLPRLPKDQHADVLAGRQVRRREINGCGEGTSPRGEEGGVVGQAGLQEVHESRKSQIWVASIEAGALLSQVIGPLLDPKQAKGDAGGCKGMHWAKRGR